MTLVLRGAGCSEDRNCFGLFFLFRLRPVQPLVETTGVPLFFLLLFFLNCAVCSWTPGSPSRLAFSLKDPVTLSQRVQEKQGYPCGLNQRLHRS